MKKIILTLVILSISIAAAAQDTVRYPDRWYGYTYREALMEYAGRDTTVIQTVVYDSLHDNYVSLGFDEPAYGPNINFGLYPDPIFDSNGFIVYDAFFLHWLIPLSPSTTTLYGIALTMDEMLLDTAILELAVYRGVHHLTRCYSAIPDTDTNILEVGITSDHYSASSIDSIYRVDLSDRPLVKQCVFQYDYELPFPIRLNSNCYEFYFDTPIDMTGTDTAYVGISAFGSPRNFHIGRDTSRSQIMYETFVYNYYGNNNNYCEMQNSFIDSDLEVALFLIDTADTSIMEIPYYTLPGLENAYWADCYWGGIFPIVEPRCTAPRGLRLAQGDKIDTVLWRSDTNAALFQLALCPDSLTPPDNGTLVTTSGTSYTLPEQAWPDSTYYVYLRKMCTFYHSNTDGTDTVWSDWSGPLMVPTHDGLIDTTINDTTTVDTTGIAGIGNAMLKVDLTPNPASGEVTVRCGERMELLELFNAAGDKVFSQQLSTFNFQFSTYTFPTGTYLVRITTEQGIATRKLVIR